MMNYIINSEVFFMLLLAETKIYKNFQTAIPKEIRKRFDIDKNTLLKILFGEKYIYLEG